MIWRMAWSSSSSCASPGVALGQHRAHGLEEADVVADAHGLLVRHRQREGLRQFGDRAQQPCLAVLLRQDVLLRGRQQRQTLLRRARRPLRPVEAVEQPEADLVLLQHHRHGLAWSSAVLPVPPALRVGRQRLLQLVGEPR
jgi:hypothetical protein